EGPFEAVVNQDKPFAITSNPISSWAFALDPAYQFAAHGYGTVIQSTVPAEAIFSTPFTGFGAYLEAEVVVLGGPHMVQTAQKLENETSGNLELDLSGAVLSGVKLETWNLEGFTFAGADLSYALLGGAQLNDVDLSGAVLEGVDLEGSS